MQTLSVVIPVFNEKDNVPLVCARLKDVLAPLDLEWEIIFALDPSTDGTEDVILAERERDDRVKLMRFSRRFGQPAATLAGLAASSGDAAVVIDCDLQDPPEVIAELVERWREGFDVVYAQRRTREGETLPKRIVANVGYRVIKRVAEVDIPPNTGDFRLMSRRAVDALLRLPERNRYMKGLYAWIGLPTLTLPYDRTAREAGSSKWNYPRLIGLALEGITSFSVVPLRLALVAGALTALAGGAYGAWIVVKALLLGDPVPGYPSLVALIALLGGTQLLGIGVVGEYVGKTYLEAKQRPLYVLLDELWQPARSDAVQDVRHHV